jgi:predicted dehydrogenase
LVGVADADSSQADRIAEEYETVAMREDKLLEAVDAVSVVVPTQYHLETALHCIEHGVHVLIEKPIAANKQAAVEIIEAAEAADVIVQVGHIERFNPAIQELDRIVKVEDIVAIRTERLGPPPERDIQDNSVIDLMIHDVDVVTALLGGEPAAVSALGTRENKYASATLQFDSGVVATLISSRLTQRKVRKLKITTKDKFIEVDYLDQTIEIYRQSAPEFINKDDGIHYRHESVIERPQVKNHEPLKKEIDSFVESIRTNTTPVVSGRDGLRALELVQEIDESAKENDQT